MASAQQFLSRELTSFSDELFPVLFYDIDAFSQEHAKTVFDQGKRLSIYGVRGIGKTTAMQGILMSGLQAKYLEKPLPLTISVQGAKSAANLKELEDSFYRSTVAAILDATNLKKRSEVIKDVTKKYAPWIAKGATQALGLVFPPLALASDIAEKAVKNVVNRLGVVDSQRLLTSKDIDIRFAANQIIKQLEEDHGFTPVYVIDELDKVSDDTLLSDFFDGNQAWFQGKVCVMSLTYSFGESIKDAVASSVSRISTIKQYPGIQTLQDVKGVVDNRIMLGLSQVEKDEGECRKIAEKILPEDSLRALLNVGAPSTYIILENAYRAITNAMASGSQAIMPEHIIGDTRKQEMPTDLEYGILQCLEKGRKSPVELADLLDKKPPSIVRALAGMMKNGWVVRVGSGKRAYYSITADGTSAGHRYNRSND